MARMSEQPGLTVPVVWSEDCLRHEPGGEVWLGVRDQGTEVPARALVLRDALAAAGAPIVPARPHGDEILRAVHDGGLLDHLAGVWAAWEHEGYPAQYGRDRVVPYVFPTPGMLGGLEPRMPPAVHGRAGLYCYDTMTLIGPGSWAAIRGAADAALTAGDLVGAGAPLAYALCRPPGHHVTGTPTAARATSTTPRWPPRSCRAAGPRSRSWTSTPTTATAPRRCSSPVTTCSSGPCTWTPARVGSRTSSGYAEERGTGTGTVGTATCRCRRGRATTVGSARCTTSPRRPPRRTGPTPS